MKKAEKKRLPHGQTSEAVLVAIWLLHLETGRKEPVSREQLVKKLRLPDTTIDDRLRMLLKEKEIQKIRRGLYVPIPKKRGLMFDRYTRQRNKIRDEAFFACIAPNDAKRFTEELNASFIPNEVHEPSPKAAHSSTLDTHAWLSEAQRLNPLIYPDDTVVLQFRITLEEYLRQESKRQREKYLLNPEDDDLEWDD